MIIEKTVVEGNRYSIDLNDYVAENELTVTITLSEYRKLIQIAVESQQIKEHESWLEEYCRANNAEARVKELEDEVKSLYKRIAEITDTEQAEGESE